MYFIIKIYVRINSESGNSVNNTGFRVNSQTHLPSLNTVNNNNESQIPMEVEKMEAENEVISITVYTRVLAASHKSRPL